MKSKTIEEMNDVIQAFCSGKSCFECAIKFPCDEVGGAFETNPTQCEEAYKIIMSLRKPDPTANPTDDTFVEWHKELFPEQYVKDDPVNHPAHYNKGKIEVSDFIWDQKLNFDRGNAVKYLCRAGAKDPDKEIQDLEKAIWYINHEIKMLKGE